MTAVAASYVPRAGIVAVDAAVLRDLVRHARGRPVDDERWQRLTDAGLVVDDRLDAPLRPVLGTLLADGPRLRVLSLERGRTTVTDVAVDSDGSARAAIVVRPAGSSTLHLQHTTAGSAARHVARTIGVGAHVAAVPPHVQPLELRDWAVVRAGFAEAEPAGWVRRRRRAELHQVRWAASTAEPALTALVVANLDGGVAEVRPGAACDGGYTVIAADTGSVWRRLCALTAAGPTVTATTGADAM